MPKQNSDKKTNDLVSAVFIYGVMIAAIIIAVAPIIDYYGSYKSFEEFMSKNPDWDNYDAYLEYLVEENNHEKRVELLNHLSKSDNFSMLGRLMTDAVDSGSIRVIYYMSMTYQRLEGHEREVFYTSLSKDYQRFVMNESYTKEVNDYIKSRKESKNLPESISEML